MTSKNTKLVCVITLMLAAICAQAQAQRIVITDTWGERGKIVAVEVGLAAPTTMTAALLRIEYDPAMLENPSAMPGPLLSISHVIDSHDPEPGRVNVAVYPITGNAGLTNVRGTLFTLFFDVKSDAQAGISPVRITSAGTPGLPGSDLTDTLGSVVTHTTTDGSVGVAGTAARGTWMLYP